MLRRLLPALLALTLALGLLTSPTQAATPTSCGLDCDYYLTGSATDVTKTTTFGINLAGGGTDVDEAFQWMIRKSGGGDFVVLRTSGADGYNPYIYTDLGGVNSVETFVLKSRSASAIAMVADKIRKAEALFIAGGDQNTYVSYWKDTPIEDAINSLVTKGVPIGGTSAGLAILGEWVYTAKNGSVTSSEALANPYNTYMTFDRNFLGIKYMGKTITDTHFYERDRMGRLVGFMARMIKDGWGTSARGIGVDEETAFTVESNGSGTIRGVGRVYFLSSTQAPTTCVAGQKLTFKNVKVYKTWPGDTFNLSTWSGSGGLTYYLNVNNGTMTSTQSGGYIY